MASSDALGRRDDGLRRASLVTRWVAAGAVGAAGMIALVASRPSLPAARFANPNQTQLNSGDDVGSQVVSPNQAAPVDGSGQASSSDQGGAAGLQAPVQAPVSGGGGGYVSSGAS